MIYSTAMLDQDYVEVDPSPLATQALKMFAQLEAKETPETKFKAYCKETPWAVECKIYED